MRLGIALLVFLHLLTVGYGAEQLCPSTSTVCDTVLVALYQGDCSGQALDEPRDRFFTQFSTQESPRKMQDGVSGDVISKSDTLRRYLAGYRYGTNESLLKLKSLSFFFNRRAPPAGVPCLC
jgi:hypothetical protein